MTRLTYLFILLCTSGLAQFDTVTVYFDVDQFVLSKSNKEVLSNVRNDIDDGLARIEAIQSHTDTSGSIAHNKKLSKNRLLNVLMALTDRQIGINSTSFGESFAATDKNYSASRYRRVDVILFRPFEIIEVPEPGLEELSDDQRLDNELNKFLSDETSEALIQLTVNFYPGRAVLLEGEETELQTLYSFLKENPEVKAKIRGHVCCGSNLELSQARALVVYDFLTSKGISSVRLSHRGYDNSQPYVWPEITEEDKSKNRRVDVIFTK